MNKQQIALIGCVGFFLSVLIAGSLGGHNTVPAATAQPQAVMAPKAIVAPASATPAAIVANPQPAAQPIPQPVPTPEATLRRPVAQQRASAPAAWLTGLAITATVVWMLGVGLHLFWRRIGGRITPQGEFA